MKSDNSGHAFLSVVLISDDGNILAFNKKKETDF